MSDDSQYVVTAGIVQKFGDNDVYEDREANESTVRSFTIKTITTQSLVRISVWDEMADIEVEKGTLVGVDGKYTVSDDGKYHNISATSVSIAGETRSRTPKEGGSKKNKTAAPKSEKAPF